MYQDQNLTMVDVITYHLISYWLIQHLITKPCLSFCLSPAPAAQPVTAIPKAHWATSVTQLQASASAGRVPLGVNAQTASRASGASLPAAPASVTAMQTVVTHTLGSAESAGTTQLDTSVNGKDHWMY